MKSRSDVKNIIYCIISVAVSLIPVGFLYMIEVRGKNILTSVLKSLLKLV